MTAVALIGSPLLGPAMWRSTAAALATSGWHVSVVPGLMRAPYRPEEVLEHLLDQLPVDQDVAVVAHSNAGLYVPALSVQRTVVASVFADAALPPATGLTPVAPPQMQAVLRDMADAAGLLPPWTQWWPEHQVAPLFPDPAIRAVVEAEQHRLPLEYFTAVLAVPDGWTAAPAAYLAFSEAYHQQRNQAADWGWPIHTVPGGHLHPLADPSGTAAALEELLYQLSLRAEK